jgi:hypothetical protein
VLPRLSVAQPLVATLRVGVEHTRTIPQSFVGLSYESSQLSHPQFFSAANTALIQFSRTLGKEGVLRIGGNMSEFTIWDPQGTMPAVAGEVEGPDPGRGSTQIFPITPQSIDYLAAFLRASGWKLIYGLNLARGTAEAAAREAAYVSKAVGDYLIAFQFGNEPDLFKHNGDRKQRWTYEEFIAQWNEFYDAIRAVLPNAPIAGPDTSFQPKWNVRFAQDVGHKILLHTAHYYAEGPPTDPHMTVDYLLHPGERLKNHVMDAIELARQSGVPYRMSEGNTCYITGKRGVSDTFASALWVADFMLSLAQAGATGVNLHGGGDGLYTPIAGSASEGYTARPIYYGILLASQLLGSSLVRSDLHAAGKNIAAYAATTGSALQIIVVNREPEAVAIDVVAPQAGNISAARVWRLEAPSIESTSGVTLAQAGVVSNGVFQPKSKETLAFHAGNASLRLAPYSAALVTVPGASSQSSPNKLSGL